MPSCAFKIHYSYTILFTVLKISVLPIHCLCKIIFLWKYVFQQCHVHKQLESSDRLCCMCELSRISQYYTSFHKGLWLQSHSVYFSYQYTWNTNQKLWKRWWINWLCRGDTPRPFHVKSLPISVEICLCKSPFLEDWLAPKITCWREAQEYINKLSQKEHMTLLLSQESATQQKVGIQLQMAAFQILKIKIFLKHLFGAACCLTEWIFSFLALLLLPHQGYN